MMNSLSLKVRGMSIFGSVKVAEEMVFPVEMNAGGPFFHGFAPRHAEEPAFVVAARPALILPIDRIGYMAEIGKSIVFPVAVHVVNVILRPFTMNQRPRKPVKLDWFAKYHDALVPVRSLVANLFKDFTGFRVVAKQRAQKLNVFHSPILGIPKMLAKVGMIHPFAPSS